MILIIYYPVYELGSWIFKFLVFHEFVVSSFPKEKGIFVSYGVKVLETFLLNTENKPTKCRISVKINLVTVVNANIATN